MTDLFPWRLQRPRIMKDPSPPFWHGPWQLSVPLKDPVGVGCKYFDTWRQAHEELALCIASPDRWPAADLKVGD